MTAADDGLRSVLPEYLRMLRRRKWLVLTVVVLAPLAAVLFSLRQQTLWQASAEVLLNPRVSSTFDGLGDPSTQDPLRYAETQVRIARTPALAEQVKRATNTTVPLLGISTVDADPDANILTFHVQHADRAEAAILVNAYARLFTRYTQQLNEGSVYRARLDVLQRMADLRQQGEARNNPVYNALQRESQALRTIQNLQVSNAVLLKRARTGTAAKVQPRPVRNAILALGCGLLLGIALALLRETLDTRVRTAEDVQRRLDLPLLVRIAAPSRRLRRNQRLAMLETPGAPDAEAFRTLRANVELRNLDVGAKAIMITSAVAQEGKSTTIANLAVTMARSRRHVILVDLDMRRPAVDRFFDLEDQPGVTGVLLGDATVDEALVPVALGGDPRTNGSGNGWVKAHGSLRVLTTGPLPPDPGEFVGTRALEELLGDLRTRADIVLVDSPPLLHVGDGITLSNTVDALVVVARLDLLRRSTLDELNRILDACPVPRLGFVLTGAQTDEAYGYEYSSGRRYVREADEAERVA